MSVPPSPGGTISGGVGHTTEARILAYVNSTESCGALACRVAQRIRGVQSAYLGCDFSGRLHSIRRVEVSAVVAGGFLSSIAINHCSPRIMLALPSSVVSSEYITARKVRVTIKVGYQLQRSLQLLSLRALATDFDQLELFCVLMFISLTFPVPLKDTPTTALNGARPRNNSYRSSTRALGCFPLGEVPLEACHWVAGRRCRDEVMRRSKRWNIVNLRTCGGSFPASPPLLARVHEWSLFPLASDRTCLCAALSKRWFSYASISFYYSLNQLIEGY